MNVILKLPKHKVKNMCFMLIYHKFRYKAVGYVPHCKHYQSNLAPLSHKQWIPFSLLFLHDLFIITLNYYTYSNV